MIKSSVKKLLAVSAVVVTLALLGGVLAYANVNGVDKHPINGESDYYEWCEEMMERYGHSEEFMEDWMHRNETSGEHHGMGHGEAEELIGNDGWHGCH